MNRIEEDNLDCQKNKNKNKCNYNFVIITACEFYAELIILICRRFVLTTTVIRLGAILK